MVDGHMERGIVQVYCPNVQIRILNCNGHHVPAATIVRHVVALLKTMRGSPKTFLILDREGRRESAEEFASVLGLELEGHGYDSSQVGVVVADRCTENWLLADVEGLKGDSCVPDTAEQRDYEGKQGKSEIRKLIKRSYHETTVGVRLFKRVRPEIARANSLSYRRLTDALAGQCRYFDKALRKTRKSEGWKNLNPKS